MRILLATDGSDGADAAVSLVAATFSPDGVDRIDVVTVAAGADGEVPAADSGAHPQDTIASRIAEAARDRLAEAGFEARARVLRGHPAERIVEEAASIGADLVVLGTHGRGRLGRLIAGSVSSKVARYAGVPVLIADGGSAIERIILAVDGSSASAAAIDFAAGLPYRERPSFAVCTAYDVAAPWSSGIAPTMIAAAEAAHHEDLTIACGEAERTAAAAIAGLAARGIAASSATLCGAALDQLVRAAADQRADLIVVGDRGRSAIERFILGSTSAGLVAAPPTSVLVVRPGPSLAAG